MDRKGSPSSHCWALVLCGLLPAVAATNGWCRQSDTSASGRATTTAITPILVELFTSEGCSSCPPADILLQKLDESQPVPGAHVIVLSEHVNYWDHDGWKDPNSSAALTDRQNAYVHALGLKEAYTPQFIVDGSSEMPIGDPQQIQRVFQQALAAYKIPVHIGAVSVDPGSAPVLRTRIEADGGSVKQNADVYAAVALDRVESRILRGENGGRQLTHVAVVQQLIKIEKLPKGADFSQDIQFKLPPGSDPKNLRIVAFVQEESPARIIGAASLDLATESMSQGAGNPTR